jgi:ribosomal protein S18 acetylase RimI-like enzyme
MAGVPWPEALKKQFLDQQFELQHAHFVGHYPDGEFLLIEGRHGAAGRLYRRCAPAGAGAAHDLLIDIAILPAWRSRGIGRALLEAMQIDAASRGHGVELHVLVHNPRARRLYERMGFVVADAGSPHVLMRWR